MSRQLSIASMTLGVMALVGGIAAMVFGSQGTPVRVSGWGPFDGWWQPVNYYTLGAVLAVLGSGFFTFGFLNRHGRHPIVE